MPIKIVEFCHVSQYLVDSLEAGIDFREVGICCPRNSMNEVTSVSVRSNPTSLATSRSCDGVGTLTAMIVSSFVGGWGKALVGSLRRWMAKATGRYFHSFFIEGRGFRNK